MATFPLSLPYPLDLLKFYNFASPFVRTLRSAARQSLRGFEKFCFFNTQMSLLLEY